MTTKRASRPPASRPSRRGKAPAKGRPLLVAVGLVVALLLAGLGGAYVAVGRQRASGTGALHRVTLPADVSADALALLLEESGIVQDAARFRLYERVHAVHPEPGEHVLRDNLTLAEIHERLERRPGRTAVKVVVPEGFTRFDIARRLEERGVCARGAFVAATSDGRLLSRLGIAPTSPEPSASAEGFLFPATYDLGEDDAPEAVVERLVGEFDKRWKKLAAAHPKELAALQGDLHLGRREVVTLASLVEKEAATDEERPLVASVFTNRLRDPAFPRKVLQSDPTAGYGCAIAKELSPELVGNPAHCGVYTGKITAPMNHDRANRYSTYTHEGLPPGPIANPGVPSLEAAIAPASTKYLYFVARGGGRHTFSETLDAHNAAVHPE